MDREGHLRHRLTLALAHARAWRPTGPHGRGLARSLVTSYLALGSTLYVLPGRQSSGPVAVLGLVLAVAVIGALLRPVLAALALALGSFGLLMLGVVYQAIILDVAIALAPDLDISGSPEVLLVSWVAAAAAAVVNWVFDAGSEDVFLSQVLGRAVRVAHRRGPPAAGGLLVLQLDGVGEDVVRLALTAGDMPTLAAWVREQTHVLRGWHTGLPATTPAGQAVLLHGDVSEVPSFRWYEKQSGRLMVANHPRDAAEIESRISTGHGLLADGGVSVSNLFSGDAPRRLLTMSDARLPARRTDGIAWFATSGGVVRSCAVAVGQVLTELYQGRRQRRRDVRPRVRRGLVFAVQRAVTVAILRDLTIALVAEQIARGAPVIYADFLDYDEVAHHAGPTRPESMRTLEGLDRLVRLFADVVRETGQPYEIAVVSDHGQVQGATFAQLAGATLQEVVGRLIADRPGEVLGADATPAERWGSANLLLTGVARSQGPVSHLLMPPRGRRAGREQDSQITLGHGSGQPLPAQPLVVVAAGSLAHVYLPELAGRVERNQIEQCFPGLIEGLAAHPYIGAVVVRIPGQLVVLGSAGWRVIAGDRAVGGDGVDPLRAFGSGAAADLSGLDRRRHVGDLVLLGRCDPDTGEVAAFEDLVGSHGGLGGAQTGAMLLHPVGWQLPPDRTVQGIDVHRLLVAHLPRQVAVP